jgi:hypothetical protein
MAWFYSITDERIRRLTGIGRDLSPGYRSSDPKGIFSYPLDLKMNLEPISETL